MERALGRIFLIALLIFLTFVFYLQVNALGVNLPLRAMMKWEKRKDEIECYYFTGVTVQKVTYHNARADCPTWLDLY